MNRRLHPADPASWDDTPHTRAAHCRCGERRSLRGKGGLLACSHCDVEHACRVLPCPRCNQLHPYTERTLRL